MEKRDKSGIFLMCGLALSVTAVILSVVFLVMSCRDYHTEAYTIEELGYGETVNNFERAESISGHNELFGAAVVADENSADRKAELKRCLRKMQFVPTDGAPTGYIYGVALIRGDEVLRIYMGNDNYVLTVGGKNYTASGVKDLRSLLYEFDEIAEYKRGDGRKNA